MSLDSDKLRRKTVYSFIILVIVIIIIALITCFFHESIPEFKSRVDKKDSILIKTNYGRIRGKIKSVEDVEYVEFLGIPYAKPPINDLRFKRPEEPAKWSKTLDTISWPNFCQQINFNQYDYLTKIMNKNMSEDCLYLNIWKPNIVNKNGELLPIIVYIHGGVFIYMGSSYDIFNGGIVSGFGGVIFVTINYRLGVFGFLDNGVEDESYVQKNVGIYDQIMALNWIKNNALNFGGDPNSLTLMGQSAGAIAIGLLMASPLSSHLFVRAILESSSPMQMKVFYQISNLNHKKVVSLLGCNNSIRFQEIDCLRKIPESQLNQIHEVLMNNSFISFSPTIPSDLLPQFPREAFDMNEAENDIKQKQILLGSNSDEGTLFLHQILPKQFPLREDPVINRTELTEIASKFTSSFEDISEEQNQFLFNIILKNSNTSLEIRNELSIIIGDFLFKCPVIKFADNLNEWENTTVYMYYFSERSGLLPEWIGSAHFEEVQFVFGLPLRYQNKYTAEQIDFSKRLIKTWTHFAKTGEMLPQLGNVWPKYTEENGLHMVLNSQKSGNGFKLNENNCYLFEMAFNIIK